MCFQKRMFSIHFINEICFFFMNNFCTIQLIPATNHYHKKFRHSQKKKKLNIMLMKLCRWNVCLASADARWLRWHSLFVQSKFEIQVSKVMRQLFYVFHTVYFSLHTHSLSLSHCLHVEKKKYFTICSIKLKFIVANAQRRKKIWCAESTIE